MAPPDVSSFATTQNTRITRKSVQITTTTELTNKQKTEEDVNYVLVIGTPIILVIIFFVFLFVIRIRKKRKGNKTWRSICNCTKQQAEGEEYEKRECFDNEVYGQIIALDVNSHMPSSTGDDMKPSSQLLERRKRSTSCPAMTEYQISKVSVTYENIDSPIDENPLYVYIDPTKFTKQIEEARRHRSESDVTKLKVYTGSSQEKFQRSLTRLNPYDDIPIDHKFASYIKMDGAESIYKIPSSVPKYDPPRSRPPSVPKYDPPRSRPPSIPTKVVDEIIDTDMNSNKKQTNKLNGVNTGDYGTLNAMDCGNEVESPYVPAESIYIDMKGQIDNDLDNSGYQTPCLNVGEYEAPHVQPKNTYIDKNGCVQIDIDETNYQALPGCEEESYRSLLDNAVAL